MAEETTYSKWEGKATAELRNTTAEQVWPLFEDFCSIHKWLPSIDTCRHVQGVYGEPGLVRYCSSTVPSSPLPNDADQTPTAVVKWCHEKLLSIDPIQRRLSYEIAENNIGFTSYVAELKVTKINGGDDYGHGDGGCRIEWFFKAEPLEGWKLEDLSGYVESSLKAMAERIEKEFQTATS